MPPPGELRPNGDWDNCNTPDPSPRTTPWPCIAWQRSIYRSARPWHGGPGFGYVPHLDPLDRLLAAQAMANNLVLASTDRAFAQFEGVVTLR